MPSHINPSETQNLNTGFKNRLDWPLVLALLDGFSIFLSIWMALLPILRPVPDPSTPLLICGVHPGYWGLYGLGIWLLMKRFGVYRWPFFGTYRCVLWRVLAAILLSAGIFILVRVLRGDPRLASFMQQIIVQIELFLLLQISIRTIFIWLILEKTNFPARENLAFVGQTPRMELLVGQSSKTMGRIQNVIGYFQEPDSPQRDVGYTCLGSLKDLEEKLWVLPISRLALDESCFSRGALSRLAQACVLLGIELECIPSAAFFWSIKQKAELISGLPVMSMTGIRYGRISTRIIKRFVDVVGSLVALVGMVTCVPIMLVLAVVIRMESPGPIFIRQRRAGLYGKPFWIYKLRSMRAGEEEAPQKWAADNDPRCTRFGQWMRRWNLDELPQFWNVLRGDMSLVGPRPEMSELVGAFCQSVTAYSLRFMMKPGMSGWAAVHGLRGNTSLQERINYDLYYIQNWSLSLDLQVLFRTMLPPKNAN